MDGRHFAPLLIGKASEGPWSGQLTSRSGKFDSLQNELHRLAGKLSSLSAKEAKERSALARAHGAGRPEMSPARMRRHQSELSRINDRLAKLAKDRASLEKKIAQKRSQIAEIEKADATKRAQAERRLEADRSRREQQLSQKLDDLRAQVFSRSPDSRDDAVDDSPGGEFDVFISHASEDKDSLVRKLADRLESKGLRVWYDESTLQVGDSLRRSIDQGLARSRFGVVVLSPDFFSKNWPQYELDGLVAKEVSGGKVILPIWHRVTKDEVMSNSPTLADRLALNTSTMTIDEIAHKLTCAVAPASDG